MKLESSFPEIWVKSWKNALSCCVQEFFNKFIDPVPETYDLQNVISSSLSTTGTAIMMPPQILPLQMAERLRRAHPDSAANHVAACSISDWRALLWLATETCWARSKRSASCSGKLISVYMFSYDVNRRYCIWNIYV